MREEIHRNKQEVNEERLKKRTDESSARMLSRMTREAEQKERRLKNDMEQLRSQEELTLGTLDTRIDAMMERGFQAIMDRLDGLWGTGIGSRNKGEQLREAGREPKVNFSESSNIGRSKGSTRGRDNPSTKATGSHKLMKSTNIHKELHLQRANIKQLLQTRNLRRQDHFHLGCPLF